LAFARRMRRALLGYEGNRAPKYRGEQIKFNKEFVLTCAGGQKPAMPPGKPSNGTDEGRRIV